MFKRPNRKKEAAAPVWKTKDFPGSLSQEEIARRAYEKFEARGGRHGNDLQDWLDAERELKTQVSSRS